ncbi:MAG: hypothetical protein JW934_09425 [Anaerolineae bacterium]|nr:hypothetical protein [Anaerolineae bacterium]
MRMNVTTILLTALVAVGFLTGLLVGAFVSGLNGFAFLALPVLVVGFLAGWLAEWYLDTRQREAELSQTGFRVAEPHEAEPQRTELYEAEPREALAAPDPRIAELIDLVKDALADRQKDIDDLLDRLAQKDTQIDQVQAEFARYAAKHPDDLTAIKGVGRVYQSRLRDAGINTFAELAASTPERIRTLLQAKPWQKISLESWIEQAKALAG